jgi:hypothetical protein
MWYPSVAVTPGDLVHVTWTRDCPPERVVSYRQRNTTGWGPLEEVTAFAPPAAKPAYHASVEAYGDRVYAVWKSMEAPGDMGEIWRAWRDLWDPTWWEASNLSQNPATASDYPQQSTHWACAWQDPVPSPDNEDIWGRIYEQTLPIHQDPLPSTYPNIAAEWSTIGEPPRLRLYSIWTSETPIQNPPFPFEVLFQRDDLFPPADGFDGFTYYDCGVGDSAKSPYCLARDGFARWRNHKVDFGHSNLRYRLPFLNPNYDYKLRAVLYQASRDTWQQAFVSDSVPLASVRHRPLVPETVWIDIPRESYAKDCEVTLDINKLAGQYAAVTELRLYECFPCNKGEGGMQGGQIAIVPSATRVGSPRPSLFRDFTNLSYTVAVPQRVNVEVYDIQGRKVRRLASGMCKRGTHFARWNGLDDLGRRAPAGAYVLRVESEGTSQTRKVVYMR